MKIFYNLTMNSDLEKLLKKYQLEPLSIQLSSSHEGEVNQYRNPNWELQSLIVFQEIPEVKRSVKHNFFHFTTEKYCSILNEKVNRELMERNNALCQQWDSQLAQRGITSDQKKYGRALDRLVAQTRREIKQKLLPEVMQEQVYDYLLSQDPNLENKADEIIEKKINLFLKNTNNYNKFYRKINRPRQQTKPERIFDHQVSPEFLPLINHGFNSWLQVYLLIDHQAEVVYYALGRSRGSYGRQVHGFFGHLFAELKPDKSISTLIWLFNHRGIFTSLKLDHLVLVDRDLTGNYAYEQADSQKLLASVHLVKNVMDLDFDMYINTGTKIDWREK